MLLLDYSVTEKKRGKIKGNSTRARSTVQKSKIIKQLPASPKPQKNRGNKKMKTPEKKQNSILLEYLYINNFSGFYNSIWLNEYSFYDANEYFETDGLDYDLNFKEYTKDIADNFFERYSKEIINLFDPNLIELSFNCLHLPKYYNYETDTIFYNINILDIERFNINLLELIEKNYTELKNLIQNKFTPRDGYLYLLSNNIEDWKKRIKNNSLLDSHLSYLIDFLIYIENNDIESDICEYLCGNGYNIESYMFEVKQAV